MLGEGVILYKVSFWGSRSSFPELDSLPGDERSHFSSTSVLLLAFLSSCGLLGVPPRWRTSDAEEGAPRSARTSSSHALASTSCSLSPFVAPFTSEAPLGYCVPRGGLKGLTWGRHLGDTPSAEWLWSPDSIRQFGGGERDWRFSSMVECSLALEHSRASVRPWNQCSAVGRGGVGGRPCAW